MKAEIISVGTEILLGEITDTNSSFLAGQLPLLGIDLYWISQVGDNYVRLGEVLKRAWQRSDLILITGGLGPTEDDITRETIAKIMGEELRIDPVAEKAVRERFSGREMASSNIKQAMIIDSAESITNVKGTAPGWWVEKDDHIIVAMPGPPRELYNIWDTEILPRLRKKNTGTVIFSKTLKVYGLAEGTLGEMVSPLLSLANPTLGIYAKADGVHLRFTAKAQTRDEAATMVAQGEATVREMLGGAIWGIDDDTLASVVGRILVEKNFSLSVMEFRTRGILTTTIVDTEEAEIYFKGGITAYSEDALIACGIDSGIISNKGLVSAEMAEIMARTVRRHFNSDIGISICASDSTEGPDDRSVNIVYTGIDCDMCNKTIKRSSSRDRFRMTRLVTVGTLFELRKVLLGIT
ncbi:CinA family nicotinamide mononucleotide deamidase-related protein [Chloroflexota bacterium]